MPQTMNKVSLSVRWNNEAVSRLASGNVSGALNCFKKAVAFIRSGLDAPRCRNPLPEAGMTESFVSLDLIEDAISLPDLSDCNCYIYNKVHLIRLKSLEGVKTSVAASAVASIVIFNMALTYHRVGWNNSKCVDRAINLYKMVLRIVQYGSESFRDVHGLLKCAAMNNQSQLRFEQGHYALAREGLDSLFPLVAMPNDEQPKLQPSELNGLIMNVLFLRPPTLASAA